MGLASAPKAFGSLLQLIFAGLGNEITPIHHDDVSVFRRTFKEHLKRLELFFQRLSERAMEDERIKPNLVQKRVSFLGNIITESGVKFDPEEVKAVKN